MCHWQRGSVLILVVWTISLLSILAFGLGSRCAFALSLSQRLEQQLRASYIAAAGITQAAVVLRLDENVNADGGNDPWANNSSAFNRHPFGEGAFSVEAPAPSAHSHAPRYGLTDQERFININTATAEILKQLSQEQAGLKDLEATTIAESIIDWRDEDKEQLPNGAEEYYYLGLNPSYSCKNAAFESVEELLLIRGMRPEIFQKIQSFVTVYGSGAVNINTASEAVLSALGISRVGVLGLLAYYSGEDDQLGTDDDRLLTSVGAVSTELQGAIPAEDANRITELASKQLAGVRSTAFEARSTGDVGKEQSRVRAHAVIDRDGRVLSWEEK